jgi:hypothetical protein
MRSLFSRGGCWPRPVQPECVPNESHWTRHWTVGDALKHFERVPAVLHSLEAGSKLASIWHYLTLGMQSQLEQEFAVYDWRSGRV